MTANIAARIRIPIDNPIGAIIIQVIVSAAAIGIVYWVLDFIVNRVILHKLDKESQDKHILNRIINWFAAILALVALVLLVPTVLVLFA
jgi:membrane protein YqaA with SNARE-associated domain